MITIFLGDDYIMVREGLRLLLETQPDFKVIGEAAGGPEARQAIARDCPDIAILEIITPDLKGINAVAQVHETCPTTRVIVLSLYVSMNHVAQALQAGARSYLSKSASGRELIEAVRAVHAGHVYLSQQNSDRVIHHYLANPRPLARESRLLARLTRREREIFAASS